MKKARLRALTRRIHIHSVRRGEGRRNEESTTEGIDTVMRLIRLN